MSKRICANLGFLYQIAGLLTIVPIVVGLFIDGTQALTPLFLTCVSFLGCGFLMNALCERKDLDFKSSCALILLVFLTIPLIGAVPYIYSDPFNSLNPVDRFTNAYFESVSGFTTTGFSFIPDSDVLPQSFLLYRSVTELMGGVGIVFILLSFFNSQESLNNLGNALGMERIEDNLKKIFLSVFIIYAVYIVASISVFYVFGYHDIVRISSFAIDTLTGGYQPATGKFEQYLIIPMRIAMIILMFLGSVNFSFNYHLFALRLKKAFSTEVILYVLIIMTSTVVVFYITGNTALDSLFHVVSMSSSTGYDYMNISMLNDTAKSFFILLMVLGGCGFSMAGGVKMSRVVLFFKSVKQAVIGTLLGKQETRNKGEMLEADNNGYLLALTSILLLAATLFTFSIVFSTIGISFTDAFFEMSSALTTNGVSMGATNVSMPMGYKWLIIIAMIIGRVEIMPILIALTPALSSRIRTSQATSPHAQAKYMIYSDGLQNENKFLCSSCGIIVSDKDISRCRACGRTICGDHTISKRRSLILSDKYCPRCASHK